MADVATTAVPLSLVLGYGIARSSAFGLQEARNAIFASAFGEDPEFFEFYRSLTAYKNALQGKNSTMVISPDSEFFDYLKSDIGLQ